MTNLRQRLAAIPKTLSASLTRLATRRYGVLIVAAALCTAVATHFVAELKLKADFIELLPQRYQSVIDLRKIVAQVGGLGNLSIAFMSEDVQASERLADDLARVLDREFRDRIRYYDYKIDALKAFYEAHAPLYVGVDDLETIRDRLRDHVTREKRKKIPLFTDLLDDEPTAAAGLDFSDIEAKYDAKTKAYDRYIDGYYTAEGGRLLAMLIKPKGESTNIPAMTRLVADLQAAIGRLRPETYAADMKVGFAGNYKTGLEEYETLKNDILGTALLCLTLVSLSILAFFRRLRAVLLLGICSVTAVLWTFAVTYFAIGYLNTVTAFLGAIIAGTGINYGIILLARYFEERRLGATPEAAVATAIQETLVATFGAASTTAVAFGVFMLAEVKSFSQFGFIGLVGIVLIWLASYTLLPAMVVASEALWPSVRRSPPGAQLLSDSVGLGFLAKVARHDTLVLTVFGLGAVAGGIVFLRYLPTSLEYDMSRLRTKSSLESGTAKLDHRISRIFDVSMTPAVLVADTPEEARAICAALAKKKAAAGDAAGIERCRSIYSFLPSDQEAKLALIAEIRDLLSGTTRAALTETQRRQLDELEHSLPPGPLGIDDLPEEMTRYFVDTAGRIGTFVYVDPREGRNLWNAENLLRFTSDIRQLTLTDGKQITSSGEAVIFADLLTLMKHDSPIATALSFLAVFLLVVMTFGSLSASAYVTLSLLVGSLLMVGAMAAVDVKLNFFNFVALPMTFGIGVDYSINIYQRYLQEGRGSLQKVFRRTGGAVLLCSLTTIIGYLTLIIADSNALVSLGGLAILGEFTCLATALVALPAFIARQERRPDA